MPQETSKKEKKVLDLIVAFEKKTEKEKNKKFTFSTKIIANEIETERVKNWLSLWTV